MCVRAATEVAENAKWTFPGLNFALYEALDPHQSVHKRGVRMRNYLLAAVAAAALTTPAMARDNSVYVGVDAGVMLVEDTNLDFNYDYDAELTFDIDDGVIVDHNLGFDVDLVAGYDFGLV